jgi:TRAP-type C4-dicarboxylate transport system permease small subunit
MFQKAILLASDALQRIAGVLLVGMMLLTCLDVVGNLFGHPILGTEELVSLIAALLLAFVLPSAHLRKAHIGIDLLYARLSTRQRKVNDLFIGGLSFVFFLVASWQCFTYAGELKATGEVSATLELPLYFVLFAISMAFFILAMAILTECLALVRRDRHA